MEEGEIEVDSIKPIGFPDITPELARESGARLLAKSAGTGSACCSVNTNSEHQSNWRGPSGCA